MFKINSYLYFMVCYVLCLGVCAADSATDMRDAQRYLQAGDYASAIIQLKKVLQKTPNQPSARADLVQAYISSGDGLRADIELKKALRLGVPKDRAALLRMKIALLQEQFSAVQNAVLDMSMPVDILGRMRAIQGFAALSGGDIKGAKALFHRAELLAADAQEVRVGRAKLFMLQAQYAQAKPVVVALLAQYPTDVDALLMVGELYRREQKYAQAHAAFEKARTVQPGNLAAWLGVVTILINQEQYDEAWKFANEVARVDTESVLANYFLGVIAYKQQAYVKAHNALRATLKLDPQHQEAHRLLGAVLLKQNRLNAAQAILRQYLQWQPQSISAAKTLAAIYLKQKLPHRVIKLLMPLLSQGDAQWHALVGSAYLQMGRYNKSAEHLAQAVTLAPNAPNIQAQFRLSQIAADHASNQGQSDVNIKDATVTLQIISALKNSQFDQAIALIETALETQPENPMLHNFWGAALVGKQAFADAQVQFKRALEIDPKFVTAELNLARLLLRNDDYTQAKRVYEKILFLDRHNLSALLDLAWISDHEKKPQEVLQWMQRATQGNPRAIAPRLYLNDYYRLQRNLGKALQVTQELIEAHPQNLKLLLLHGQNLMRRKSYTQAITHYQRITERAPESPIGFYQLGQAYLTINDEEHAQAHFRQALQRDAEFFPAQAALARLALLKQQLAKALMQARQLESQHPEQPASYEILGDALLATKRVEIAVLAYQTGLEKGGTWVVAVKLYHAYVQQGDVTQAHQVLRDWLQRHPRDVRLRMMLAGSLQQQHLVDAAALQYLQVIKQNPRHVGALNNIAWIYLDKKDVRALEYAEVAYSLDPENVSVMDTLGWMLVRSGAIKRGLGLLSVAVKNAPQDTGVRYHYARALQDNGEIKSAVMALKRVVLDQTFAQNIEAQARLQQLVDALAKTRER